MSQYLVRVQLITWYEIVIEAPSPEDAFAKAEVLPPERIRTQGKHIRTDTGLADPESAKPVE
jgi:hypothetical protein